jgi:hypothetical protein
MGEASNDKAPAFARLRRGGRMTNDAGISYDEARARTEAAICFFVIRVSTLIRHSDFVVHRNVSHPSSEVSLSDPIIQHG